MSKKRYPIHIWFLDNDLLMSAQMLDDKSLVKTIDGCIGCIVSTCMHLVGIRSKKFYSYFFSKENAQSTIQEKFQGWPLDKNPKFNAYGWKEAKWCRMCHENYDYVVSYLSALLDEYAYRHSSMHASYSILQWATTSRVIDSFPYAFPYAGIKDVVLPWKSIDPRFRSIDIVEGYRKQYCSQIEDGDAFAAYARCKRDIPQFVVDTFSLSNTFEH